MRISKPSPISELKSISTLSISVRALAIIMATLAFFYQDLTIILTNALFDESSLYILAVPFLFVYLVYRKRKMLRAAIPFEESDRPRQIKHLAELSGFLLCSTAIILYWYGSYTFTPLEYHILTLPIFAAGLTLILFNSQTLRQLAFPVAFLVFLAPPPAEMLYGLGAILSVLSSEASNAIVNVFGIPSTISSQYGNPTIIIARPDNTPMTFTIDIACSGIYSLIGFVIFAIFIAYITRGVIWKKISILLLGTPFILALNIIRISIILSIGYHFGEQLALQVTHIVGASVLMFLGTLILLVITEKAFKKPPILQQCQECSLNPPNSREVVCHSCGKQLKYLEAVLRKTDIAKMAAIAVAVILLLSIQAPVFALTEGPAQVIIQTPTGEQGNTQILPQIQGYTLKFSYRDTIFEQLAKQDASLVYAYTSNKTKEVFWVTVEISSVRSRLHGWETCLITFPTTQGYEPKITQLDLRDTQILENPPIIARYFAFQYKTTNQTQLVLYWYEASTFSINNTAQQKHVKISLIMFPSESQNLTEAEDQLLPLAMAIANYWRPIETWSQIALAISQNGPVLATIVTLIIVLALIYQAFLNIQERKSNLKVCEKLPSRYKLLLKTIIQVSKIEKTTEGNLARRLGQAQRKQTRPTALSNELEKLGKAGLVKREIDNRRDEPVIIWKSRIKW